METKPWRYVLFGLVCGLLATGFLYLVTRPPRGVPVTLQEPPGPEPIVVHVLGAVSQPGVYQLPAGSRVQDAISAAGGALPDADLNGINLAAILQDGTRLLVPSQTPPSPMPKKETTPKGDDSSEDAPAPTPADPYVAPSLVNINTAGLEDLDRLPGIGPSIAQRIIDYRAANGNFAAPEDLQNVKGIGPATYEKLKDLITVGP